MKRPRPFAFFELPVEPLSLAAPEPPPAEKSGVKLGEAASERAAPSGREKMG